MKRAEQYESYLAGSAWTPATERAAQGITGSVFRHEPQITAPPALESQLADITQTGVPLRMFAEQVVLETLLMGRYGLLVDFPGPVLGPDGQLRPPPVTSRPYWIGYKAEEVINWRSVSLGSLAWPGLEALDLADPRNSLPPGRPGHGLTLVVCKEVIERPQGPPGTPDFYLVKPTTQYRELSLNAQGLYEVKLWAEDPQRVGQRPAPEFLLAQWMPTRQGQPLDFIPFVFLAPFSLEPIIQKSLMEGLVRRNLLNFRHSADLEWARHLACMPTLCVAANMEQPPEIYVGGSQALFFPDNQAKAWYAETTGHGITAMENAIKEDLMLMAALGARLLEGPPQTQETATGVQWRLAGADSPTQALISVVNQGITWALQVHSWWQGLTESLDDTSIHMNLNKDLVSTVMEPQALLALMQALLNGTISYETYWWNLQRGEIARPGVDVTEEMDLIELRQEQQPLVQLSSQRPGQRQAVSVPQNGAVR